MLTRGTRPLAIVASRRVFCDRLGLVMKRPPKHNDKFVGEATLKGAALDLGLLSDVCVAQFKEQLAASGTLQKTTSRWLFFEPSLRTLGERLLRLKGKEKLFGVARVATWSAQQPAFEPSKDGTAALVFVLKPNAETLRSLLEQLRATPPPQTVLLLFSPAGPDLACSALLESQKKSAHALLVGQLALHAVALDSDVLSMELPDAFRVLWLDKDVAPLRAVADVLLQLERLYGTIPVVRGKGTQSAIICGLLQRLRFERDVRVARREPAGR
jgi:hypothetical protein